MEKTGFKNMVSSPLALWGKRVLKSVWITQKLEEKVIMEFL